MTACTHRMLRALVFPSLTLFIAIPSEAAAQHGPAYELSWEVDLPIVLLGGALASSFFLLSEARPAHCAPLCDPATVNAFDREFAGNYDPTWGTVADVTTAAVLLLGPVSLLIAEGWLDGLNDGLVVAEAALLASGLQVVVSYAVARPRPRVYAEKAPLDSRDDANAARSFFSGHVSNGVAATVATALAFFRTDRPIWAWTVLGIGLLGSALNSVARVGGGSHFPSDCLVGAAVGAAIGIAVPALHRSGLRLAPNIDADSESGGLTLGYRF